MNLRIPLLLGLGFLTLASRAVAQTPAPTVAATPTQTLSELQCEMAEHTFSRSQTIENRALVVFSYEQVVAAHCPRDVEICERATARLRQLDAANPIAACYHDGFAGRACKELSAAQKIGWYDIQNRLWQTEDGKSSGPLKADDLDIAIAEKRLAPELLKIAAEKNTIETQAVEPDRTARLVKLYQRALALTCRSYKLVLEPTVANDIDLGPTLRPIDDKTEFGAEDFGGRKVRDSKNRTLPKSDDSNPFDSVLHSLSQAEPTATPTVAPLAIEGPRYTRIRLIPKSCYDFASELQLVDKNQTTSACIVNGPYAAACQSARQQRTASATPIKDGLSGF